MLKVVSLVFSCNFDSGTMSLVLLRFQHSSHNVLTDALCKKRGYYHRKRLCLCCIIFWLPQKMQWNSSVFAVVRGLFFQLSNLFTQLFFLKTFSFMCSFDVVYGILWWHCQYRIHFTNQTGFFFFIFNDCSLNHEIEGGLH